MADNINYSGMQDVLFQEVVSTISPDVITVENKRVISAFVDILAEFSPISVNISDVFYKKNPSSNPSHENHILGVQQGLAEMHLENFWSAIEDAKNDYILRNSLRKTVSEYNALNGSVLDDNIIFFEDVDSLFTMEKFLPGKEFKMKKGITTGLEYAYKAIWNSKIEGPLRNSYHFQLSNTDCRSYLTEGSCINPLVNYVDDNTGPAREPWPAHPGRINCDTAGKRIGTWRISEDVLYDPNACVPFSYKLEGSLMTEFFNRVVKRLAHPVGFGIEYQRAFNTEWIDYFNVEIGTRSDAVYVYSLCPGGNCAIPLDEKYAGPNEIGGGLTGSYLVDIIIGIGSSGEFIGVDYKKYILNNGAYLISYGGTEESSGITILYYNELGVEIKRYQPVEHSAILLENRYTLPPVLLTHDFLSFHYEWGDLGDDAGDKMVDMFEEYTAPIIGTQLYIQDTTLDHSDPNQPWGDEGGFIVGIDRDNPPLCCTYDPHTCCSTLDCCFGQVDSGEAYINWADESDPGVETTVNGVTITTENGIEVNAVLALELSDNTSYNYTASVVVNELNEPFTLIKHDGFNNSGTDIMVAAGITGVISGTFTTVNDITNNYWWMNSDSIEIDGQTIMIKDFDIVQSGINNSNVICPGCSDTCCIEGFVIPQGPYDMIYIYDNLLFEEEYIDDISIINPIIDSGFDSSTWVLTNASISGQPNCLGGSTPSLVPVESGISTATRSFEASLPLDSFVLIHLTFNTCFWDSNYDLGYPNFTLKLIDESLVTIAELNMVLQSTTHSWGIQVSSTDILSFVIEMPDAYKEVINNITFEYVDGSV